MFPRCLPMETSPAARVPHPTSSVIPPIPAGVRLVHLENGLTLIVREDHSAPVISAQAWCRAGSIHEGRWLGAGLSHVLEHMLFKGTSTRPGSRIDQEVQEAGGYMNAYTSFDRTVYWINVPNTGAAVAMDILGDIVQNATLPEAELTKELDVIRREMDMCQDDPGRHSARRLFETAYTLSPYRYTIIGYPDVFNRITREDIVGYYREQYAPNNLFFVVAGDVQTDEVVTRITTAFAGAKARPLPPVVLPTEPRQVAPRELFEEGNVELGHVHFSWHVPDVRHPDVPLLDVLGVLLGRGRSSRLYEQVRQRQGLVTSVDAWTYNPGGEGLFGMSAVVEPANHAAAAAAMLAEIERLKREPVTDGEIAKAVKQFVAATLASRKTMQGQAQDLGGSWIAASDLNFSARYLEAVKGITPTDLQRVACRYLTPENQTHYALMPKDSLPRIHVPGESAPECQVSKLELTNGLRLLLKEDHRLPFIEMRLVLRGGVLAENPASSGLSQLTAQMLMQGTATRSAEQVATEIESVGGSLDSYSGNNSFGVMTEVLDADFRLGLELMADVLLRPSFPPEALERERQVQLAAIKAQRDQVLHSAFRAMRRQLFGKQGYGLDLLGEEEMVSRFAVSDLKTQHAALVCPDHAVLAIYGAVPAEVARAEVESVFGSWRRGMGPAAAARNPGGAGRVTEQLDKKQAVLVLGFPGVTMTSDDRFALELVQEACSDLGSRLFLRIRDKLGLAYFVGAQNFLGLEPGYFAFYVGTAPERLNQVEQELFDEVALLRAEGLTAEELLRAKAKVIGQKKIARQDLGAQAMAAALDELYGLGYRNWETEDARYEAVTREQTRRVAENYLRPELAVLASVCPQSP